eukprot:571343-Amphidinium_carterae.1
MQWFVVAKLLLSSRVGTQRNAGRMVQDVAGGLIVSDLAARTCAPKKVLLNLAVRLCKEGVDSYVGFSACRFGARANLWGKDPPVRVLARSDCNATISSQLQRSPWQSVISCCSHELAKIECMATI